MICVMMKEEIGVSTRIRLTFTLLLVWVMSFTRQRLTFTLLLVWVMLSLNGEHLSRPIVVDVEGEPGFDPCYAMI